MITHLAALCVAFFGFLLLVSCQALPLSSEVSLTVPPHGLPNPAAVHCTEQGGTYEIVNELNGGQSGLCHFPDGSQCEGWAFYRGDCLPGGGQPNPESDMNTRESPAITSPQPISAWVGSIHSAAGQFDDFFELAPPGTGSLGLAGKNAELEAEIVALRDASGNREMVFVWGDLVCAVPDYGGCQIRVNKLRAGAFQPEAEPVKGWRGTIQCAYFNSTPDQVCGNAFVLEGAFPVQYGIWSDDPILLSQIELLRDSSQPVLVSGQLLSGVPDVNGNQIQVDQLEILEPES
jgi:putative hemolysin